MVQCNQDESSGRHTPTHIHIAMVKYTLCIYNPLTHTVLTQTLSLQQKEMILNLQEGYQIAPRSKKMSGEDRVRQGGEE